MKTNLLAITVLLFAFGCASKKTADQATTAPEKKKESSYDKIVRNASSTDEGLFTIYRNASDIYYEIPDSLLSKEMLWISRIAALPANFGGGYINAGTKTNEQVVRWEKKFEKILLRTVSYAAVASDSLPIQESVKVNNYEPVVYGFKIEAYNSDSTSVIIKVTDLFSKDVGAIGPLPSFLRKQYQVRRVDGSRSYVESARSFPLNIEVKHDLTFEASNPPSNVRTNTISIRMNQSMVLLPEVEMEKRAYDERVDWFTISQIDYGSEELKADRQRFIRRWKLIPKDPEAYARGELVEPVNPIVYYLDPATPEQFRSYFKEGIELWQKPFETAGFKNAIIAKDPPSAEEDPDFSPEDVRYSVVRYVASTTRNAIGPSVSDPRTGQIIESDIIWFHNHLRSYRNRYLLETGAANPRARTLNTLDEDIGEMMKMVIAHEVGHALGLPHNMKASAAYPTDSLRSGSFTQEYGIATTIMDYARYNYVAQPGDENIRFIRQIGPYDHYAINWGYRYFPEGTSAEEQQAALNSWIAEKEGDTMYMFGSRGSGVDPTSQTEGIGDDPVKASKYGMKNLKIVADNLVEWTATDGKNYDDLSELYGEMLGVWSRYTGHVVTNVGGVVEVRKTTDQEGPVYTPVTAEDQKKAVDFLLNEAFDNTEWLVQNDMMKLMQSDGALTRLQSLQGRHLRNLMSERRISRMIELESLDGLSYGATDMMKDVRRSLWKEIRSSSRIDAYRRNLQRLHVIQLGELAYPDSDRPGLSELSDVQALARAELKQLKRDINNNKGRVTDLTSRYHLDDVVSRIDEMEK